MYGLISTVVICCTIFACLCLVLTQKALPTIRTEHTQHSDPVPEAEPKPNPVGFSVPQEAKAAKEDPEQTKKDIQEAMMQDVASTLNAVMNGEISFE